MMATPLKDSLGKPAVSRLARNIERVWPEFDTEGFARSATRGLTRLELKQRVGHIADTLATFLPNDYGQALEIVVDSGKTWDGGEEGDPLRSLAAWPLFHFVEHNGISDFERSMAALRSITQLFSAEFAVRPFVARYPERAFAELARWTEDDSGHVRRLVSEATRPRLPWATRIEALIDDPSRVLDLLEKLKDDPERYVQRSVANNLNDIGKDHPEVVVETCRRWSADAGDDRHRVVRHALRSLVKRGHRGALEVLGFGACPKIAIIAVRLEPRRVRLGSELRFSFVVRSKAKKDQALLVDYAVHFVKADGARSPKVFKLRKLSLPAFADAHIEGKVSFAAMTTRTHWPGKHQVDVLVNGARHALGEFELVR